MSLFIKVFKTFRLEKMRKNQQSGSANASGLVAFLCILALAFSLVSPVLADETNLEQAAKAAQDNQVLLQQEQAALSQEIDERLAVLEVKLASLLDLQLNDQLTEENMADFSSLEDAFLGLDALKNNVQLSAEQDEKLRLLTKMWQDLLEGQKLPGQEESEEPVAKVVNDQDGDNSDLEIGPEIINDNVGQGQPNVDPIFSGAQKISGSLSIASGQRRGRGITSQITVTVKYLNGNTFTKTLSIPPNGRQKWSIELEDAVQAGDSVSVIEETHANDGKTTKLTADSLPVEQSMSDKYQGELKMPEGEIWIEDKPASNILSSDELKEVLQKVKEANPTFADKIDSVELKISPNAETGSIIVTYTDGSKSDEILAPDLIIKNITEISRSPIIDTIKVTDNIISGHLEGPEPFDNIKVSFVLIINDANKKTFCSGGKNGCSLNKNTVDPTPSIPVDEDGKFSYEVPAGTSLEIGQTVGVIIKEKNKFKSCSTAVVQHAVPDPIEVRDPHKLTDNDKQAIDKAIRDANTINGVSKLPDGTGFIHEPAFIVFDENGNVQIISPNDVVVSWSDGKPNFAKNKDGSYILQDGKTAIKIPVENLVRNLKPASPKIDVNTDEGKVTITPPPYTKDGEDTDLASYTVTYKDAKKGDQTITLTRTVNNAGESTWSSNDATVDVDANTGAVSLNIAELAVGSTISAQAKDKGGLADDDKNPLESDLAKKTLETVQITYDGNGGTGEMAPETINKGAKYQLLDNAFTPPAKKSFKGWKIDEKECAPGAEITANEDKKIEAIWQDKPADKVTLTFDPNGGNWDGVTANKTFVEEKGKNFTIISAPVRKGYKFLYWKGSEFKPGDNYLVEGDHTFVAQWEPSEIPYVKVPVYPNQTQVEPIKPSSQPTSSRLVTPLAPSPSVYTLPATGSADVGLTIWAGLGLALAGLLLKKRG